MSLRLKPEQRTRRGTNLARARYDVTLRSIHVITQMHDTSMSASRGCEEGKSDASVHVLTGKPSEFLQRRKIHPLIYAREKQQQQRERVQVLCVQTSIELRN